MSVTTSLHMRDKSIIILLITLFSANAYSRTQERAVVIDTICKSTITQLLQVVDSFCYQFQACPDSLFGWAYLGLEEVKTPANEEKTKESRDVIQLRYKDRVYDPIHKIGDVAIDIYVLGTRWWKDQHLVTQYVLTTHSIQNDMTAHMAATYTGASIMESGDFIMYMKPLADGTIQVHYEFRLGFGRILSLFISDKTWTCALQWRFVTILENLIECAETGTVQPKFRGPQK